MKDRESQITDALEGLSDLIREARDRNTNTATITVQAGGVGIWIATTCCAVMLGVSVMGALMIMDQQRQISDLRDFLAAIYAQAPHLKPQGK